MATEGKHTEIIAEALIILFIYSFFALIKLAKNAWNKNLKKKNPQEINTNYLPTSLSTSTILICCGHQVFTRYIFFFKFYISNVSLFMFYLNMFLFSLKKSLGKVIFQIPFERFRKMEISMFGATLKQLDPYVVH